jgi:hypothetical protein
MTPLYAGSAMSTKEILNELPKLSLKDRRAIIRCLMELEQEQHAMEKGGRKPKTVRFGELGLLTKNPSFAFLREEPDLYE